MITQLIKYAFRSFRKTPLIHLLNLTGLTIGLSVFFLVSLYVYQEKSYESDFSNKEDIFQIGSEMQGMMDGMAVSTPNLALVQDEIPEVEAITAFTKGRADLTTDDKSFNINAISTDAHFFKVFDFKVMAGDASTMLSKPGSAVITNEFATRLFGSTDVLGEVVTYAGDPYLINGVIEKPRYKTQLDVDAIVHNAKVDVYETKTWGGASKHIYARINQATDRDSFEQSMDEIVLKYIYPQTKGDEAGNLSIEDWKKDPAYRGLKIESLDELRTESKAMLNLMPKLDQSRLTTMIIVGIAALLISVINFINLSTAKATVRFKEVGVKRILGANRGLLVSQFLIEAFIVVLLSAILALGVVELVIKLSADFGGSFVEFSVLHFNEWLIGTALFILGLTLVSAIYPALYLSSNKSLILMRKGLPRNELSIFNATGFRKVATVVQFVGSISLIAAVIVMFLQIDFLRNRDLGYDDEGILTTNGLFYLSNPRDGSSTISAFQNELSKSPLIEEFGFSSRLPMDDIKQIPMPLKDGNGDEHRVVIMGADMEYLKLMKFRLIQGEMFSEKRTSSPGPTDAKESTLRPVLINQMAASTLGLEEPIGELISDKYEVVGVVEDFFFNDLRRAVDPVIILESKPNLYSYLTIKSKDQNEAKAFVRSIWEELAWAGYTDKRLEWEALESNYANLLKEENQGFSYMLFFSVLAVIVSCLGLFGLAVFTIEQRFHEFGIRKVLGASVGNIVQLFSKDFAKLIAIAFVVAIPVSIYAMQNWLNGFANRISLSLEVFLFTGLVTLFIVFFTILFQSLKAGRLNPVDTLRNE
ncbi:ABC transporter permease [Roseivirga sp.]|uniref:ABC transporter permease n=1 Tax=Roseivirga sp. TaxID=1964215 RepID=UPI002B26D6D6|nr:ABC transporter permease [Roseivirga sp.]